MKILVAEDDYNILMGLVEVLEDEGYHPIPARDGEAALQAYQAEQPDFVILDIMMPKQNGYDVCRAIRKSNTTIPILFLSAKSEEIDKVVGLELGADDYLTKPFGIKELTARIRAIARRVKVNKSTQQVPIEASPSNPQPQENTSESFLISDLMVSPGELRARRGETVIDLSIRDVKILQSLFKYKGKVLDRNTIFNECWGTDYYPNSRTLDQHISQLRKKIEVNPKSPKIIRTVHGIGYRYDENL